MLFMTQCVTKDGRNFSLLTQEKRTNCRIKEKTMHEEEILYMFDTKDGQEIRVRGLRTDDAPHFVDIFENMGSDSRYNRFHQTADHLDPRRIQLEAEKIANIPSERQGGMIAFADLPGRRNVPVGAARYVCLGDGVAETAVSVRDDMQGKGIGAKLLRLITENARERGVRLLTADVLNSNKGIFAVLMKLPYRINCKSEGAYTVVEVVLTEPRTEGVGCCEE
jgi:GNAT superfamily N-acetyltransferase